MLFENTSQSADEGSISTELYDSILISYAKPTTRSCRARHVSIGSMACQSSLFKRYAFARPIFTIYTNFCSYKGSRETRERSIRQIRLNPIVSQQWTVGHCFHSHKSCVLWCGQFTPCSAICVQFAPSQTVSEIKTIWLETDSKQFKIRCTNEWFTTHTTQHE